MVRIDGRARALRRVLVSIWLAAGLPPATVFLELFEIADTVKSSAGQIGSPPESRPE